LTTLESPKHNKDNPGGSDRSFGFVFAAVFGAAGIYPAFNGAEIWIAPLAIAAGFAVIALVYPRALGPANRLWTKFGILLSKIVNPIVLGIIYFGVVTPIGIIMRWRGKDPMRLALDPTTESYWIERDAEVKARMTDQF
jgi:predicted membrane metal-binding protein